MKLNNISIKWKLFGFIALFTAIMILVLWLFQIVFLERFYQNIKINDIATSVESIERNISTLSMVDVIENNNKAKNIRNLVEDVSNNKEICIYILDVNGNELFSSHVLTSCLVHNMSLLEYRRLYKNAALNNGRNYEKYEIENYNRGILKNALIPTGLIGMKGYRCSSVMRLKDGTEILILLNSIISPVEATVQTLRIQLTYITVIFIILALIIALIISRIISKPIIKINKSAKELAKGNYNIIFDGRGYREISELNDTLNFASHELSKVESLRRELLANVSHDLRTPLTMITGYAEVMKDIPGENTPDNVQVIIDESRRLTGLVNDLLDISKFESGVQKLMPTKYSITDSIKDILGRYSKLTEHEGYTIKFEYAGNVNVYADKTKIEQVLYNLINNAITYTGEDKTITVRQIEINDKVRIEVIDTGEGIEEDKLNYIWERYYKVDKTHKRAQMGTGLGLSIVKKILDMHKQRYGVISKIGQGSIFWFELNRT